MTYPPSDDRLRHLIAQQINPSVDTWKLAFFLADGIVTSPEIRSELDRIADAHAAGKPCGDRQCNRCFETMAGIRDAARQAAGQPAAEPALRDLYARAIRDNVRLRLGPNALRLAEEGRPVMMNMSEAEAAADAVLAVRDAARQAAGQTTQHRIPCGQCGAPWSDGHGQPGDPCHPAGQIATAKQPDPAVVEEFIRDMATRQPSAWQDGDPAMEAIAAAVWEHCHTSGPCVDDDPRNIAAAAAPAARDIALRRAASDLEAFGYGEAAAFLLGRAEPAVEQPAEAQPAEVQTARARLAALIGYEPSEHDDEYEKRVDELIAASLHEAARRMEGAGYDDDAVNFLDLLADRQTVEETR